MAWTRELPSGRFQGKYRDALNEEQTAGTFTQQKQALRAAIVAEDLARKPDAIDVRGGKIPWGLWFDEWHSSRDVAYATDEQYRAIAVNHLKPKWGSAQLKDIRELDIEKWKKALLRPGRDQKPKSPWVVRSALMLFKTSLNAAVQAKRIGRNPAKAVAYPDLPDGLERFLTPEEIEGIAFNLSGVNALLAWTGVQTGMRIGEIAGLHWNRLDLERGAVNVIETFDQKAMVINPVPKDKERRTVPLPDDLTRLLIKHRDHGPARRQTCGIPHKAGKCSGDIVFRGGRGAPIRSSDWGKNVFRKAVQAGGVEGRVRVHDLRHTYASWLIQEGVSIAEVALRMGHSDWEVTQKYAHLGDDGFDKIKEALGRKLSLPEIENTGGEGDLESRVAELERLVAGLIRAAPDAAKDSLALSYGSILEIA